MKLSITLNNKTYSVESEEEFDGSNINELAEQFKGLLVSAGFHPSNVDEMFNTEYEWFNQEERDGYMQGHLKRGRYNEGYAKGWDDANHNDKASQFLKSSNDDDYLF
jgi:Tat protein secretion system quality control protein TatD with DNase activity